MRNEIYRASTLALMLSQTVLSGCGDYGEQAVVERRAAAEGPQFQLVERAYPFTGEHGETVCAEWHLPVADGSVQVDREKYDFDKINDKLMGRVSSDEGLRTFLSNNGLASVSTCDDARRFMRLQHEYFESQASQPGTDLSSSDHASAVDEAETPPGEPLDKIREGYQYDYDPAVRLKVWLSNNSYTQCTGSLINKYAIITAAHCFAASGWYKVSVDYGTFWEPGWCISSNGPNNCNIPPPSENFYVYRHPGYTGAGDSGDDIAVAVEWDWDPWLIVGDNPSFYLRPAGLTIDPVATSFWMYGYGTNAHDGSGAELGRASNGYERIDWAGPTYWYATATQGNGHPCKGDSGGPAIYWLAPSKVDVTIGVASEAELKDGNQCPTLGSKFYYTGIERKMNWINAALADSGSPTCGSAISSGGRLYWKCW